MTVTTIYTPGQAISAAQVNQNNTDLANLMTGITGQQLSSRAGLTSSQFADKFCPWVFTLHLLPRVGDPASIANLLNLDSGTSLWTMPSAANGELFHTIKFALRTGKASYLTAVYIRALGIGGVGNGRVWIFKNTLQLGAGPLDVLVANNDYILGNSASPFDNVVTELQNTDNLNIYLGRTGGAATMRGICMTFCGKTEIGA